MGKSGEKRRRKRRGAEMGAADSARSPLKDSAKRELGVGLHSL